MRISVGLIFIVMSVEADEIFFDQKLQVVLLIESLTSGDADILGHYPLIGDSPGDTNGDAPVCETAGEFTAINYFKFIGEIVFGRFAKSDYGFDGTRPAEALDF